MNAQTKQPISKLDLQKIQLEQDRKRAEELAIELGLHQDKLTALITEYNKELAPLKLQQKAIKDVYDPKFKELELKMESPERELLEIGKRQRKTMFDTKGNWRFANGIYVHAISVTKAVLGPHFSLAKFRKKFADLIEVNLKIAELKKIFLDGELRKSSGIDKHDIDLTTEETLEVKRKSENEQEA
jgi:hypothetical protein